ncbi:prepilin-type N-terminal cleavage/methylation domain-containing protein [Synergistaceae bacterium OttesenSCG-928-I11]|nr:prepilin-type N-terminal cleavage/methylation domain-containing protein [Synergistaceae bacterium OttesenSCG-928-I11]
MHKTRAAVLARRGFSLVELLIVIVIIVVLTGAILLGGVSNVTADAFAEAGKLQNSLRSLRSAWLACYSETYEMVAVPGDDTYDVASNVVRTLSRYADRGIEEEVAKYGKLRVVTEDEKIYIGFVGAWKIGSDETKATMKRMLAQSDLKLYGADRNLFRQNSDDGILIRIR